MLRALALLGLVVTACSDLPPITPGVCGNGILEPLEDCDNATKLCVQCRILCADGDACPAGYACGTDEQCHAASGTFKSEPQTTVPFPVNGFRVTDVDHDGYGDVVGFNSTAMTVRYGDSGAKLSRTYDLVTPQVLGNPAIAHFESASIDDVVLPTADGLVVYTGAFGVPSPRQFPLGGEDNGENVGGRPDPSDAMQLDDNIGAFSASPDPSHALAFSVMKMDAVGPAFDAPTTALCGKSIPASAHQDHAVYKNANGTFVVFGNTDANGITAYECVLWVRKLPAPIQRGTDVSCPAFTGGTEYCEYQVSSLTSASLVPVTQRPVFADLDGDGCPSMLVAPSGAATIYEYRGINTTPSGSATCTMSSTPTSTQFTIKDPAGSQLIGSVPLVPAPLPTAGRDPLAPEAIVTAWGIWGITNGDTATPAAVQLYKSDRPMDRAAVGDVDGDGATDVVLTSAQPNIDIVRRSPGTENFLLVRTPTTGGIVRALFGDFDGDTRVDLAYVENLGSAQRLSIAYGSAAGLTAGIAADRFTNVGFIARMQVRDSTDPYELVEDLIVIDFINGPDASPEITLLHGSPTRTMLSYYGTAVPFPNTAFRAVIAGDFVDQRMRSTSTDTRSTGIADLFAIQTADGKQGAAIWVVPGLPNARLDGPMLDAANSPPIVDNIGVCAMVAPGDMPPSFCVEYSSLISWPAVVDDEHQDVNHDVVLGVDYRYGAPPAFMRVDPAAPAAVTIINGLFPARGHISDTTRIDLDNDGIPELVASFESTSPGDGHVSICRMQRDGTPIECEDVASELLGRPDLECVGAVRGHFHPVCSIADSDAQGNPLDGLGALCHDGDTTLIFSIRSVDGAFVGDSTPIVKVQASLLDQIQFGDVTGDNVQDVIGLDTSRGIPSMSVFRQEPTIETTVCYPDN